MTTETKPFVVLQRVHPKKYDEYTVMSDGRVTGNVVGHQVPLDKLSKVVKGELYHCHSTDVYIAVGGDRDSALICVAELNSPPVEATPPSNLSTLPDIIPPEVARRRAEARFNNVRRRRV